MKRDLSPPSRLKDNRKSFIRETRVVHDDADSHSRLPETFNGHASEMPYIMLRGAYVYSKLSSREYGRGTSIGANGGALRVKPPKKMFIAPPQTFPTFCFKLNQYYQSKFLDPNPNPKRYTTTAAVNYNNII